MACASCHDIGWVFDCRPSLSPPLMLELMPCLIPDCEKSGQPIQNINFLGVDFTHVSWEPGKNRMMSISSDAIEITAEKIDLKKIKTTPITADAIKQINEDQ